MVLALYVIERELVWAGVNELAKLFREAYPRRPWPTAKGEPLGEHAGAA